MTVLYEDNHIIAVNKAVGEIVQGDKTGDTPLSDIVKDYIKVRYDKPGAVFLGVTHRLDRPTSGVVLFARTSKALSRLNDMFRSHEAIRKTYWAIVQGAPRVPEARLEHYLTRNEKLNKSFVVGKTSKTSKTSTTSTTSTTRTRGGEAKQAILTYRTLAVGEHYSLLEVNLETGRHHQIRCQLAHIGCPIRGDLKYGARRSNPDGGISLHARRIEFTHPVSKADIDIVAPVPEERIWRELSR